MKKYWLRRAASQRLEDTYAYTLETHGQVQADKYLDGMFDLFEMIADRHIYWRAIPPQFGVKGFFASYGHHYVFWKERGDSSIAIVSILHERMDAGRRLREEDKNE